MFPNKQSGAVMANESFSISGPVDVASESKQAIAFELMKHISTCEQADQEKTRTRAYWLTLYRQCYKATSGSSLERILQDD
jgi:hypothetical protein